MTYEQACKQAATNQLLDPITDVLSAAGIPHEVEQTGGFVMLVCVPITEDGRQHLWLEGRDDCGPAYVVTGSRYSERGADEVNYPCYGMDLGTIALGELVDRVRAEWTRGYVPCQCEGQCEVNRAH